MAIRTEECRQLRVVHLPVYAENAYQPLLMEALKAQGVTAIDGGGGGNFFRTARFKWKADILHFHWLHPYLLRKNIVASVLRASRFLAEVYLLRRSGVRIVWTVHNLANHDRRFLRLEHFYTRQFARLVDAVIVHSQHALNTAQATFHLKNRIFKAVIPQGSYAECYPNTLTRDECRMKLGLSPGAQVFLFLGRIQPYKGVLELIHSFKQLPGEVHLLIAGRASDAGTLGLLHSAIEGKPNIRIYEGYVPNEELQAFFNAADVYVYPVRDILNSGSIPLAMSFGLPCIAPHLSGVVDVLGTGGGILYNPDDAEGLKKAMLQVIELKDELRQVGMANLTQAKIWTWEKVAQKTRTVYDKCIIA